MQPKNDLLTPQPGLTAVRAPEGAENCAESSPNGDPPKTTKSYFVICLLFMIYALSFSIVIPAIPGLVLQLVNNKSALASYYYGASTSMRYVLEFFSGPILGTLADVKGRKSVLVLSFAVCAAEFFLLSFAPSIPMLFVARALSGLGDVGGTTTYTIITDLATYNEDIVTQKYALIGAMFGLAFIVGPLSGGFLSSISFELCLFVAGVVASVGVVVAVAFLEETLPLSSISAHSKTALAENAAVGGARRGRSSSNASNASSSSIGTRSSVTVTGAGASAGAAVVSKPITCGLLYTALVSSITAIKLHLSNQRMRELTIVLVLSTMGGGYYFIWYMIMDYRYNASPGEIGIYLSFVGVIVVFTNLVLVHRIIPDIWTETDATLYGLVLAGVHALLIILCTRQWGLYVLSFVFCIQSVYSPALKAVIIQQSMQQAEAGRFQGNLQGILSSVSTVATALASILFSALFSLSVSKLDNTYLIFFAAGGFYLLGALYFYHLLHDGLAADSASAAAAAAAAGGEENNVYNNNSSNKANSSSIHSNGGSRSGLSRQKRDLILGAQQNPMIAPTSAHEEDPEEGESGVSMSYNFSVEENEEEE